MRKDITFKTDDGLNLAGWLYSPVNKDGPFPAIILSVGFGGIKEFLIGAYAEAFCEAGFVSLLYDNRCFGESEGSPRYEVDPILQIRDLRDAISYLRGLPEVDPDRIGIWGSSYSAGHALQVGAFDKRVKCVVAQVPEISGSFDLRYSVRQDLMPGLFRAFEEDREARYNGAEPEYVELVSEDPNSDCALPGQEAWDFVSSMDAPGWEKKVTLRSVELLNEYEAASAIERISPTPLLMIVAKYDTVTPTDLALKAYERALHPKKLKLIDGGHFDPYTKNFSPTSTAALDWFKEHL